MDTTVADPLVGRVLDGRYRIEARIAHGGMASVYRALDERLDRSVAVKIMQPALAEDDEFVRRFHREAQSAARLNHPNIVNVFDQGQDGELVYLVMEYVDGRTLRQVLRGAGRLSPGQAVAVLEAVVGALAAAHRAGIVHRDIKPENVLVALDGRIKVADFGLARAVESSALTLTHGALIGSPSYLSPEQVERGVSDQRSDVYAVGVLAFELLTGRPPYTGETALTVAWQHVNNRVPAPSTVVEGVPRSLDQWVVAATRRSPDARPADAGVLLGELRAVQTEVPLELLEVGDGDGLPGGATIVLPAAAAGAVAAPAGRQRKQKAPRPAGTRRRRTGLVWLFVVLLLAGAAVGVGWYLGIDRQVDAPRLVGLTMQQAQAAAAEAEMSVVRVGAEYSPDVPEGQIVRQAPEVGSRVDKGQQFEVVVSRGREPVEIPGVGGMSIDAAVEKLEDAGLVVVDRRVLRFHDSYAQNTVIGTQPRVGEQLFKGDEVTLVVSRGQQKVAVPDTVGEPREAAVAMLEDRDFDVRVAEQHHEEVPEGVVISQQPRTGEFTKGARIDIVVSLGPQMVEVPNLEGMTAKAADDLLKSLGLVPNGLEIPGRDDDRVVNEGQFRQAPRPGELVRLGTRVTFWYF